MTYWDVSKFGEWDHVDFNHEVDGGMIRHLADPVSVLNGHNDVAPVFESGNCEWVGWRGDEVNLFREPFCSF